jgi:hypothetical protein
MDVNLSQISGGKETNAAWSIVDFPRSLEPEPQTVYGSNTLIPYVLANKAKELASS